MPQRLRVQEVQKELHATNRALREWSKCMSLLIKVRQRATRALHIDSMMPTRTAHIRA
jgi:hypothetical protein